MYTTCIFNENESTFTVLNILPFLCGNADFPDKNSLGTVSLLFFLF